MFWRDLEWDHHILMMHFNVLSKNLISLIAELLNKFRLNPSINSYLQNNKNKNQIEILTESINVKKKEK